ncbi:hypothetical protein MRX96_027511 [Rhipicephalus microplus]
MFRRIVVVRVVSKSFRSVCSLRVETSCTLVRPVSLMSGEPPTKKPAAMGKTIGTHSGNFHCDDALACFLLKQLPEYKDATVVRSRDPAVLDTCDVVVDVGAVYDPAKRRYDHHQKTFNETMNSLNPAKKWTTKLSSAGLVYVHHGREVIAETLGWKLSEPNLEKIYDKVYENFMEEIDAIDNGINAYDGEPRYRINTNVSSRVAHLNPAWNEAEPQSLRTILEGHEADRRGQRQKVGDAGSIMIMERGGCPWKDHLLTLEEELSIPGEVKMVLYQDQDGSSWRVQGVPVTLGSFECRVHLPEKWRGLRDEELSRLSGIDGCIFVHSSGFIGGNKTKEGAIEMATRTIKGNV